VSSGAGPPEQSSRPQHCHNGPDARRRHSSHSDMTHCQSSWDSRTGAATRRGTLDAVLAVLRPPVECLDVIGFQVTLIQRPARPPPPAASGVRPAAVTSGGSRLSSSDLLHPLRPSGAALPDVVSERTGSILGARKRHAVRNSHTQYRTTKTWMQGGTGRLGKSAGGPPQRAFATTAAAG
jgi:hypothetical protein